MSDIYAANVTLLLPFRDGLFSVSPVLTPTNSGVVLSATQSKFYDHSAYFKGTSYLTVPLSPNNSTTFTVETWVYVTAYPTANTYSCIFSSETGLRFYVDSTKAIYAMSTAVAALTAPDSIQLNTWTHVAVVFQAGTYSIFIDGIKSAEFVDAAISSGTCTIGSRAGSYFFTGFMQDFRVTDGIARYTTDFTPPIALQPDPFPFNHVVSPPDFSTTIVLARIDLSPPDFPVSFLAPNPLGSINVSPPDVDYPEISGNYRIVGTVKELGVAGAYRVRLFDKQSARCIRETWSKLDGSYCFDNIADTEYFVVAYDHGDDPKNAQIFDFVRPSQRF